MEYVGRMMSFVFSVDTEDNCLKSRNFGTTGKMALLSPFQVQLQDSIPQGSLEPPFLPCEVCDPLLAWGVLPQLCLLSPRVPGYLIFGESSVIPTGQFQNAPMSPGRKRRQEVHLPASVARSPLM